MGFRPGPTRHDETAQRFLAVAAELIDMYLGTGPTGPDQSSRSRLHQITFPSALEWLRTDDVIRLTAGKGREGAGQRAFYSRWATRDDFLPDALVYALLREYDGDDPREYVARMPTIPLTAAPVSKLIIGVADGVLDSLVRHPRSYLMLHLGPLLPRHPALWKALQPRTRSAVNMWVWAYEQLVTGLDLVVRPEWTIERLSLVLQAMLDGFVLRYRLQPDEYPASRWEGASIFADAIIAFLIGAVDWDLTGQSGRTVLDRLVRPLRP